MNNSDIKEQIKNAVNYYLDLIADAEHMQLLDKKYYKVMKPKTNEQGASFIYNICFKGLDDKRIKNIINEIKDINMNVYWGNQPNKIQYIIDADYDPNNSNDMGNMALLYNEIAQISYEKIVLVKQVKTKMMFEVWANIVNKVMHDGYVIVHPKNHYHLCENDLLKCYLAFFNDRPVSTAAILIGDDESVSLEFVSTIKEYRRQGFAKEVSIRAIDDTLKSGVKLITLRALGASRLLYESIGFKNY